MQPQIGDYLYYGKFMAIPRAVGGWYIGWQTFATFRLAIGHWQLYRADFSEKKFVYYSSILFILNDRSNYLYTIMLKWKCCLFAQVSLFVLNIFHMPRLSLASSHWSDIIGSSLRGRGEDSAGDDLDRRIPSTSGPQGRGVCGESKANSTG